MEYCTVIIRLFLAGSVIFKPFGVAILTATFYAPTENFPTPITADHIIPLSNLSPTLPNYFSIENDTGAITNISLPNTAVEAFVEIFCSGNAAEEFWYSSKLAVPRFAAILTTAQILPTSSFHTSPQVQV